MLGSRDFSRGFYIHVCLNSDEITAYMYVCFYQTKGDNVSLPYVYMYL